MQNMRALRKNTSDTACKTDRFIDNPNRIKIEAVLFDVDGVLRDVSQSYRMAIKKTVEKISGRIATNEEIIRYKSLGINNDWELSYQILKNERNCLGVNISKQDVMNSIISIFQQLYLGEKIHGKFTGFIENEKIMIDLLLLEKLFIKHKGKIGIVSTAPRKEVTYALEKVKATTFFQILYSMEDLDETKEYPKADLIKQSIILFDVKTACYLGDGVSDMKAAKVAGVLPIGILPAGINDPSWEPKLIEAGALHVFSDVNSAIDYLLK